MKVETALERQLLGAIGGFMGVTSGDPTMAADVLRAAELDQEDVKASFKDEANDRFNATMWNLCNSTIGAPMLTHEEILNRRRKADG